MDKDNLKSRLSTNIKKFRKEYKLSQFELAERNDKGSHPLKQLPFNSFDLRLIVA
jgi:hypothetical protein